MRGRVLLWAAVTIGISACGSTSERPPNTVTVTETRSIAAPPSTMSTADQPPAAQPSATENSPLPSPVTSYSGNDRVLAVGAPRGGLASSIPPGRYVVSINDGESGAWMRCSSELCGLAYMENVIAIENASGPDYAAVMEVEPSDVAIKLIGITLTPVQ